MGQPGCCARRSLVVVNGGRGLVRRLLDGVFGERRAGRACWHGTHDECLQYRDSAGGYDYVQLTND